MKRSTALPALITETKVQETLKIIRGEKAIYDKIGLRRTAIEELLSRNDFPKPVRLGKRARGFFEHELDEWLRTRANERVNK